MNTEEKKRSVIRGIFIFIGIVIFLTAIFTLAGKQKRFVKTIELKAVFNDVSGLQEGNNVWFSGVKIGTVKEIKFYGTSQVEITMNIEDEARQFIRKDVKAKVSSEGFIGNKNIVLIGGNPRFPAVEDGDMLQVERDISTDEIMKTFQENNKNLVAITNDFKEISAKIKNGEGTIGAVLTDSLMANNFKSIVNNLNAASVNTVQVSEALSRFSSKLNTRGGLANQILTDTTVFSDLKSAIAQLERTTISAAEITKNLTQTSRKLNTNDNAIGVLLNDNESAESLKATLKNLETSTKKLDQNMEALQHNFLLRGFFKKQAKKEAEQKAKEIQP